MTLDDDQWLKIVDTFHAAAIGEQSWHAALDLFAQATGSQYGELIGLGSRTTIPIHLITNADPSWLDDFEAMGGGNPAINPRVNAGIHAKPLQVLRECDFITPDEYKRNDHIQELRNRWDWSYICLSTLHKSDDLLIGLAVGRTAEQGHVSDRERDIFASLAPHVRSAVLTQIALEGQHTTLLTGMLETLSMAAFLCDENGLVRAMTPCAETLISGQNGLKMKLNKLYCHHEKESRLLSEVIRTAATGLNKPGVPLQRTLVLSSLYKQPALTLDVMPLPQRWQHNFSFIPKVLVLAKHAASQKNADLSRRASILQIAYRFTSAEIDIAHKLVNGLTLEEIAHHRKAAADTVRTQIKSMRHKLSAHNQAELINRLHQL